jgi:hypothetical protein
MILNLELNPTFAGNGIIVSISDGKLTVFSPDGMTRTLTITNETEVHVLYSLSGFDALTLIGKQATYTLNPQTTSSVRILRIVGMPEPKRSVRPTTVEFKKR